MTDPAAQRNRAIDRVFAAALELDESERGAWLQSLRARDPRMAEAVERLLAAADAPDPRLDPERWIGRRLRAELGWLPPDGGRTGERVGPWRVLEEIGRGGMSVVYRAERADGLYEQQVALKFLGVSHELGVQRFRRERRILAALNHPGIARLLDGGADELGRPYIVMEYVNGRPLDAYCRETVASLERRLDLIAAIADAVEYAHRNLVVHRDIKPSNILVTDDGQVKLLDFGIAKLLDPSGPEDVRTGEAPPSGDPATRTQVRVLTPEYASPEQVLGDRITTASDVYQLGVVLYELLAGRRPFDVAAASPSELERVIRHEQPLPPSSAATRDGGTAAAGRGTSALRRRLRGDLDTVVLKAIAKEPERRYASVGELRDDLLSFRRGAPVRARPQTLGYRTARFVRRHRAALGAAAAAVAILAGYAATVTVQSRRIAAEAAKTELVKDILASLFTAANPGVTRGAEPTASELLQAGARKVNEELAGQPDVQAELLTLLGEVYGTMGRYDAAVELLEPALAIRRRLLRSTHPELARTAHQLAHIRHIRGDLAEAESLMREALAIREAAFGAHDWRVGMTLDDLGDLLHTRGELLEAERVLRRAVTVLEARGDDGPTARRHLANVRRDRGSVEDAEALYRRSLQATETRHGRDDPVSALTRSELAVLLAESGRTAEAGSLLGQNLAIYEALYPGGHAMVGTTLRNLGIVALREGRPAAALELLDRAVAVYRETLPPGNPLLPRTQRYMAEARLALGDAPGADALAAGAVAELRHLGLAGHPAVADALEVGAMARLLDDREAEAAALLAEAVALRERLSVPADRQLIRLRAGLAALRASAAADAARP